MRDGWGDEESVVAGLFALRGVIRGRFQEGERLVAVGFGAVGPGWPWVVMRVCSAVVPTVGRAAWLVGRDRRRVVVLTDRRLLVVRPGFGRGGGLGGAGASVTLDAALHAVSVRVIDGRGLVLGVRCRGVAGERVIRLRGGLGSVRLSSGLLAVAGGVRG